MLRHIYTLLYHFFLYLFIAFKNNFRKFNLSAELIIYHIRYIIYRCICKFKSLTCKSFCISHSMVLIYFCHIVWISCVLILIASRFAASHKYFWSINCFLNSFFTFALISVFNLFSRSRPKANYIYIYYTKFVHFNNINM